MSWKDDHAPVERYNQAYFEGRGPKPGYNDYATVRNTVRGLGQLLLEVLRPRSVLDVGAAYGFLVEYFHDQGVDAWGVEPSEWARSQAPTSVNARMLAGALPCDLAALTDPVDLVTCTEVLKHLPEPLVRPGMRSLLQQGAPLIVAKIDNRPSPSAGSHLTLRERAWWEAEWDACGAVALPELEAECDRRAARQMPGWVGTFYVRRPAAS